jgi:hypothetical protein
MQKMYNLPIRKKLIINKMQNLTPKDLEAIEALIYHNADDIAVAIARSFERLEDRIDAMHARLYTRIAELETLLAKK